MLVLVDPREISSRKIHDANACACLGTRSIGGGQATAAELPRTRAYDGRRSPERSPPSYQFRLVPHVIASFRKFSPQRESLREIAPNILAKTDR